MKKAILHIGTEKTGTTSIQKFLFQNRSKLMVAGRLFPASAGYISNQRLVVYAKRAPEADIADEGLDVNDPAALDAWKDQFVQEHCAEVMAFHARHPKDSTVIYSAEHLQSRLTTLDEIRRVARLLRPLFDEITVVVYLRRQDKYALSAHSTSVRGGNQRHFSFEGINAVGPYYNYRELLENWSEVFGKNSLTVRLFERNRLVDTNVVADFCRVAGIDVNQPGMEMPEAENEALSYTALSLLRTFNALDADNARLLGIPKSQLRGFLLDKVQVIEDDLGRVLPARESAEKFYQIFEADNQWIADSWLDGEGFETSFLDYPEHSIEPPVLTGIDQKLDELIDAYSKTQSRLVGRIRAAVQLHLPKAG